MIDHKLTDNEINILALKDALSDSFSEGEIKAMFVGLLLNLFMDDYKEITSYLQEMRNKFDSMSHK